MGATAYPRDPRPAVADPHSDRVLEMRRAMEGLTLRMRMHGGDPSSRLGLQDRELAVLSRVVLGGPVSLKELVADLQIPPSSMTSLVDRLEAKGLVRRAPSEIDRRLVVLEATPTARTALEESMAGFTRVAERVLAVLSESEQAQLVTLLRRVAERL